MEDQTRVVVVHGPSTPELEATLRRVGMVLLSKGGDTTVWGHAPRNEPTVVGPPSRELLPRPSLLTIPEAAVQLGVGRSTIYRLLSNGDLDAVHVGRAVRIPAAAVDELVQRLRTAGGTPDTQRSIAAH